MRSFFVGIEYAGKSTLIDLLTEYYYRLKLPTHDDDHFTIPDRTLSPESRALMLDFPDDVKERMQRMQINYHIGIIRDCTNPMISGWYIEEAIYSEIYGKDPDSPYYENYGYLAQPKYEAEVYEMHLPDVVLIHVTASDEAIRERMKASPHEYEIINEADIPEIKRRFEEEVEKSIFTKTRKMVVIDTTDKTPEQSLDELLLVTEPLVTYGELALRALPIPDGDYDVRYENGVRKMMAR